MKHRTPSKPKREKPISVSKKKRPWVVAAVTVVAVAGFFVWQNKVKSEDVNSSTAPSPTPAVAAAEKDHLVGRWVRTDSNGGYTLDIRSASADGKLEAKYFNPNPINVGRAEWQQKESGIIVVVELRDVNYPGSTYTLSFSQTNDQLLGTYFQAVEGVNYDVAFARIR
jgi:hypothetical protein